MADNNPNTQVADSFGEMYNVATGDKKAVDDAYARWCKKRGIATGMVKKKSIVYGKGEAKKTKKKC